MTAGSALPVPTPSAAPTPAADPTAAVLDRLDAMTSQLEALQGGADPLRKSVPGGAPGVRRGESALTSRGYSFLKLFQLLGKKARPEDCRVEIDTSNDLHKYWFDGRGYQKAESNSILAPFGTDLFPAESESDFRFVADVKERVKAGVSGADRGEMLRIAKALSWNDATALGDLVAPPMYGELIDLLRNNEVFSQAGASMIGMPPNGRIMFPRQTGASTAYYVGESTEITASEPTTGDLMLSAKKVATLVKVPNELFRYASVSVEAFLRNDMAKVMALRVDKELLEGVGSAVAPKGLINYAGIQSHTSAGTPADGNSGYPLQPEDIYQMIGKVEERNAVFKSFVMRPLMWTYVTNRRADAVTAGDGKGMYLFNAWRELATGMDQSRTSPANLAGYPVYKSTNISNVRTRGSGATFTYILGGDFTDYVIAMSPTIEFALANQTTEAFTQDQTWIRAILPHDAGPRREASFIWCDQLLMS